MESDYVKIALQVFAGVLAAVGGLLTFVSGRLRDAEDQFAKERVLTKTWYAIALVLWVLGAALAIAFNKSLLSVPFYVVSFAIQWKLFLEGPEPASRQAVASFALTCALTALAVVLAFVFYVTADLMSVDSQLIDILKTIVRPGSTPPN